MVKTEAVLPVGGQAAEMAQRLLQQRIGADDIGLDEVARRVDRAVDMAFGRQVDNDVRVEVWKASATAAASQISALTKR
jgi:20S proteasome alpha/beta subunit